MEHLINTLKKRAIKTIPLFIIIPLLLGGLGYFWQVEAKPLVTYEAKARIELGYYEDLNLNEADTAKSLLTNHDFLSVLFDDYDNNDLNSLKRDIEVKTPSDTKLEIRYSGESEEDSRTTLSQIVEGFLEYDLSKYEARMEVLEDNYEELRGEDVDQVSKVDKQRFVYELQNQLLTIYPAQLADPVTVNDHTEEEFSPIKRAVLGAMVGVTVAFGFLVIPVLFREEDNL
ncbi:hypothetical protein ACQCT3_01870 [Sutcliffiella horikoshii]|uniref:hypothetical protein n=1 Tax=Sutcliffiella horikoshii TaxID=79883 RepID=UPI003CE823D9